MDFDFDHDVEIANVASPDDFANLLVGDVWQADFDILEKRWPNAADAVMRLHAQIEYGQCSERTSLLDMPLWQFTRDYVGAS